jgi:hypothetical protein
MWGFFPQRIANFILCKFFRAVVTKYHILGGLNERNLPEAGESQWHFNTSENLSISLYFLEAVFLLLNGDK